MRHFVLLGLLFHALLAFSQKKVQADNRLAGLDQELQKVLAQWKAAGFAVAIVEKDSIIYARGFGVKNINTKEPVTPNTLFAIGSCTKAFTSTLIGMEAADGKLDIDKPVRNYLPELRFYNDEMNNEISLRDMMSHRTGLPRHDYSWYLNPGSRDSLFQRIQYQEPTARPKEKWQYNNFMFLAQGMVVEKLSGQTWEQNMVQRLMKPLGMTRTNMPYEAVKNDPDVATPHAYKKDSTLRIIPHYNIGGLGPAGSVYSSVNEMANWVRAWINDGKFKGVQVIPKNHHAEAMSSQMVTSPGTPGKDHPDIHFNTYGFGWSLSSYKGHYRVEHGGAIDGFIASTTFFPSDSIGIIVLTNQGLGQITSIVRNTIVDRMLRLPKFDWHKQMADAAAKAKNDADSAVTAMVQGRQPHNKPSHPLQAFEGIYSHMGYGSYHIYKSNDSLYARTSKYTLWLEHWQYNIFTPHLLEENEPIDTSDRSNMRFNFQTGVNGEISSMAFIGIEDPSIRLEFKRSDPTKAMSKGDLQPYTGEYELAGMIAKIYIVGESTLTLEVPGQPPYALTPVGNHKFVLKVLEGYSVVFEIKEGENASAASFVQPNGTFKALRKK